MGWYKIWNFWWDKFWCNFDFIVIFCWVVWFIWGVKKWNIFCFVSLAVYMAVFVFCSKILVWKLLLGKMVMLMLLWIKNFRFCKLIGCCIIFNNCWAIVINLWLWEIWFKMIKNLFFFKWVMVFVCCKVCCNCFEIFIRSWFFVLWLRVLFIFLKLFKFKNIKLNICFWCRVDLMVCWSWFLVKMWLGKLVKWL